MIDLLGRIFGRVHRHMWFMAAIVLAGLVLLVSGDFSWTNIIFSLIVLVFLAAALAVISTLRRSINAVPEQKEP